MYIHRYKVLALINLLILVSCSSAATEVTPSVTEVISTSPQTTMSATVIDSGTSNPREEPDEPEFIPTSMSVATPSPPLLPENFLSRFFDDSDTCKLPCWQNVFIGRSNLNEVQMVFEDLLGFNEPILPLPRNLAENSETKFSSVSYFWEDEATPSFSGEFGIQALFDESAEEVQALSFYFGSDEAIKQIMPLQSILEAQGEPTYILASATSVGQGSAIELKLIMIYERGFSFAYFLDIPTQSAGSREVCFGNVKYETGLLIITYPVNDLNNLTPSQRLLLEYLFESTSPIQELFDRDLSEIASRITTEANPCFLLVE